MPYSCFMCEVQSETVAGHCLHIRFMHSATILTFYCCHCPKVYSTLQCLRKHLNEKHPDNQPPRVVPPVHVPVEAEPNEPELDVFLNEELDFNVNVEPINVPEPSVQDFQMAIYESSLALAAKLYSDPSLNRARIQDILNLSSDFMSSGFLDVVENKLNFMLRDYQGPQKDIDDIRLMFSSMHDSLKGLNTERQRLNAFKDSNCYVEPQSFYIGVGEVLKLINGERTRVNIDLTGQYIKIPLILKKFFQLPGVFHATLDNIQKLKNSDKFTNIVQSPLWERIERELFDGKIVIPLVLYFDDAEPDNQTGSHSGDHSLGLLYYFIPCLPQHLLSQLEYIFVASIFLRIRQIRTVYFKLYLHVITNFF